MFIKRCPHCGEELGFSMGDSRGGIKCPHCKKKYSLQRPRRMWTYLPVLIYVILYINVDSFRNPVIKAVSMVIAILISLLSTLFIPLARYETAELITMYSVNYEVKCNIVWKKPWHILRFFIYSGFSTPVIFFKEDNVQISDAWCGVFRKIRHIGSKTKCEFEFVVDTAPKELLVVGNKFKIYYKKKEIGVGTIYDVFL